MFAVNILLTMFIMSLTAVFCICHESDLIAVAPASLFIAGMLSWNAQYQKARYVLIEMGLALLLIILVCLVSLHSDEFLYLGQQVFSKL